MLLAKCTYIASAIDAKKNDDTINFKGILNFCIYLADFVDDVTIFTCIFLLIWSYLYLTGDYLPFILGKTPKDNKIYYKKNNNKIRTAMRYINKNIIQGD